MWGQTTGLYYIANNNDKSPNYSTSTVSTNYYLVPASNEGNTSIAINRWAWNNDAATPFVTTYQTNQDDNSVWVIKELDTTGDYYLIHVLSGKYMTRNDGVGTNANRRTFHMEDPSPLGNDHLFNFTSHTGTPTFYSIKPKSLSTGHRFLNPSKANQPTYYGSSSQEGGVYIGGLIGTYEKDASKDSGSKWFLESASVLLAPTISDVSSENNRITITENNDLPAGYNYRYTFSSTGTPDDPTATSDILELDANNRYLVTTAGTLKVVVERYGVVLTGVATKEVAPYPMCGTPQISFNNSTNEITITPATSGDEIYYTLDGGTPTTSSTLYSAPFSISTETTVKAIGAKVGSLNSDIVTLIITKVATPTIINDGTNIVMDCATDGATIYYTTDDSDPLGSNKQTYSTGFTAPIAGTKIRAIAVKENSINSEEATLTVAETCQMPVISLNYQTGAVTIASATEGATIRYTLDGSEPNGSSTEYTSLTLTEAKTVKARAFNDDLGLTPSAVATSSFSQVATPTIQKDNNAITILCATEGASIHYTVAASAPDFNSTAYSDPLTYDASNKSIKARSFKEGMVPSEVVENTIKLQLPAPIISVGDNLTVTLSIVPEIAGLSVKYTTDGSDPNGGTAYTSIFSLTEPTTVKAISKHTDFENSSVASAFVYYTNKNYVLQQKECKDFFLTQANVNNDLKRVTTTNIPSDDVVWHFEYANDGYYYIVKNNAAESEKEYLSYESAYTNFSLIGLSDFQSSELKGKFMFNIVQNGEYYNFQIKGDNKYMQKSNGNNHTAYVNVGTDKNNAKALWGIKAVPTNHAEMAALVNPLSFTPFTNATPCYYQIKSVKSVNDVNYYIAPVLDGTHTYAKGTDDSTDKTTRWYLKVAEETVWNTYYYVVNAETGLYMYFNGTAGSSNAVVVENKGTADKYKFLIVKTANETGASYTYNIIPKELESQTNQEKNSLQLNDTPVNALKTNNSRNIDATQWIFVLDDTYIAPLAITQNTDGESENYLKITIECPEGYSGIYDIYYNPDGTDPAIPALNTEPTAPTSSYSVAFLPAIDATTIKAVASLKTDHSKSSTATSFELPKCATPTVSSFATGTVTLGTTTTGASIYYTTNDTDPVLTGETPSSSATAPEFTCPTGKTTIKAVAARRGMQPSDVFTKEAIYMPTITFTGGNSDTYTGSEITPTLSSVKVEGSNTEYVDECIISGYDNDDRINVGTITVTINQNTTSNMLIYGTTTFEITPAGVTLTANSRDTDVYDGTEKTVTGFTSSVEGLSFTGVSASGSGTVVGEYSVTFTGVTLNTTKDDTGNYVVTGTTNGILKVKKKALTITADSDTKEYDGTALIKNGYTNTDLATGDVITSVTVTGSQIDRGDSDNVPSAAVIKNNNGNGDDVTGCYEITYVNGTLSVTGRGITITAGSDTKVYDGTALTNDSYTYDNTKLYLGDAITSVTVSGSQTIAGSSDNVPSAAVIKNGGTDVTANYTITYMNGTLEVTKKTLTITAKPKTITYGEAPDNDGVTYSGFVNSESGSVLGGTLDYDYSYTQYGNVGNNYTIMPKGLTSTNYDFTYQNGTLTVNPKEVGVDWTNTELTYNGSEQAPTATATGLVNNDDIVVSITGAATNAGSYTATASSLTGDKKDNYLLPEDLTRDFTIAPKSLGDGNQPADGISISLTAEGELSAVQDGSTTLVENTDYTYTTDQTGDDKTVIVTGKGNYTESAKSFYVNPVFTDPDGQGSSQAAAVYKSSRDLAKPTGITPYIVRKVNPSIGTMVISPLDYIPEDVPVLLLSNEEAAGFAASPKGNTTPDVADGTKNSNQLKVSEGGEKVEAAQIYMFYKGEFVLTKAGTLSADKFFLYNPNFTAKPEEQSSAPSYSVLQFVVEEPTGINDVRSEKAEVRSDWYTLDGRRLSGQPNKSGIYIRKGQKMYIKRK